MPLVRYLDVDFDYLHNECGAYLSALIIGQRHLVSLRPQAAPLSANKGFRNETIKIHASPAKPRTACAEVSFVYNYVALTTLIRKLVASNCNRAQFHCMVLAVTKFSVINKVSSTIKMMAVAREPAPALKNNPWRACSPYVCMGTVHACALVQ